MPAKKDTAVALPEKVQWKQTVIVRSGGFASSPPPQWALDSVKKSYDDTMANAATPALQADFADEKQAKAVLHQLRRAAGQLGYGLSAKIDGKVLTFQAKEKKKTATTTASA